MTTTKLKTVPFHAVMADPPWPYDSPRALVGNGGRGSMKGKASLMTQVDVTQHYKTMSLEKIMALPVASKMADDALLFLWVTNAYLADGRGSDVVRAWGFKPKTVITWAKTKAGSGNEPSMKVGHWFRGATEHIILGVRGKPKRPVNYPPMPTWHPHPRLAHSVKPEDFYLMVERTCSGPWLELFARRPPRDGWTIWGDEVECGISLV